MYSIQFKLLDGEIQNFEGITNIETGDGTEFTPVSEDEIMTFGFDLKKCYYHLFGPKYNIVFRADNISYIAIRKDKD